VSSTRGCSDVGGTPEAVHAIATQSNNSIDYLVTNTGEVDTAGSDNSFSNRVPPGTVSIGMTEDSSGTIYLSRATPNRVDIYRGSGTFGAQPTSSLPIPGNGGALAVAPDGTVYAAYVASGAAYVAAFGPTGQNRTIGPLPFAANALSVDRSGELYVAENGGEKVDVVDVFAANANGAASPLRELVTPIPSSAPGGSAILSLTIAD
jgi:sugar lactone lactonase YvrE